MLGQLEDPTQQQMKNIHKALKNTKNQKNRTQNSLKQYSDVNNKLANGFKVSLNVIVDLSKVLKNYHYFLDEIEEMLSSMDKTYDERASTVKDLKSLTDEALNKLTLNYNDQLTEIVQAYENNNMNDNNLKDLKKLLNKK
jgi:uncharacterized protein YjiS (DUF1127 family)